MTLNIDSGSLAEATTSASIPAFDLSDAETLLLYLVNRTRRFPESWGERLSVSLPSDQIGPFAPLVPNGSLLEAARLHSAEMLAREVLSHTGADGSSPFQRAVRAGYPTDQVGENVGYDWNYPSYSADAIATRMNDGWFTSSGHRANMLTGSWTEFGGAFAVRQPPNGTQYATELFGRYDAGPFLTGVVFVDRNSDVDYDAGEGIGGVTITASGPMGTFSTVSMTAGGWLMRLPAGQYSVTASGGAFSGTPSVGVNVAAKNVQVDFISGRASGSVNFAAYANTAPSLNTDPSPTLPPVVVGSTNPGGVAASSLLGTAVTDPDPASRSGIAVTGTTGGSLGTWQYSIDGGGSWVSLATASANAARLLRGSDLVRFVPQGGGAGNATMQFRAWDQTAGTAGGTIDSGTSGGTSSLSMAVETATVTVMLANTAPALLPSGAERLDSVREDSSVQPGTAVSRIVGSTISDPDPGAAAGIAVVGLGGVANGDWQYSLDGAAWSQIGSASPARAVLLRGSDFVRFVPGKDFNGSATISYAAWDQSSGAAGSTADLSSGSSRGGSTAFSTATATATVTVTPANDAPTLVSGASALMLRPVATNSSFSGTGTTVAAMLGNACFDVDGTLGRGVAVVEKDESNGTFYFNIPSSGGWFSGGVSPQFATLLGGGDSIAFVPNSGFTGTATIRFRLWDQSTGTAGFNRANLSAAGTYGGETAFSADVFTATAFVGTAGTSPTASFVSPTSPNAGVSSIALSFSRPVSGLDLGDFSLTRGSVPVPLSGATLTGAGVSYMLSGLSSLNVTDGTYMLALNAAESGIASETGMPLASSATASWAVRSSPSDLAATAGDRQVSLTWAAPPPKPSAPVLDYIVQVSGDGGGSWNTFSDGVSFLTTATVDGLSNGTSYALRVAAVTAAGQSDFVQSSPVTPRAVPSAPANLAATAGNARLDLSWSTPANDGGGSIVDYVVQVSGNGGGTWNTVADAVSPTTSAAIASLTNGGSYFVRVAAVNAAGTGAFTQAGPFVPRSIAGAPSGVSGTGGNGQVSLSWAAPSSDGGAGITDYVVEYRIGSSSSWTRFVEDVSPSAAAVVTGLSNGTSYTFRVAAVNAVGQGPFAVSGSVTPRAVPAAPQNLSATPDNARVQLAWTAPSSTGGSTITDYVVESSSDGGVSWGVVTDGVSTATTAVVQPLTNGVSFLFRVAAVNAVGRSEFVQAGPVVPRTLPAAPAALVATAGRGSATLTWAAPSNDGGAPVTDYVIEYRISGSSSWTTVVDGVSSSTTATVTGLANGTSYVFRVFAVTAVGQGGAAESAPATPRTVPGKPRNIVPTAGDGRVTLSWLPPTANGGSPITNYTIQYLADGMTTWKTFPDGVSTATTTTVTGLANGTSYSFRVAAVNGIGRSVFSLGPTATPRTTPSSPLSIVAAAGSGQVALSWAPPLSHGGAEIGDYVVEYSRDNGGAWSRFADGISSAPAATVTGLANGTPYLFRVAAVNTAGVGGFGHSTVVVPATVPSRPGIVSVAAVDGAATVSWPAPASDGGSPIVDYRIQVSSDNAVSWATVQDGVSTGTTAVVTGLPRGMTYQFRIAAINASGRSLFAVSLPVSI